MVTDSICQICGVIGYSELLEPCSKCNASYEHRYCMFKLPKPLSTDLIWTCEQCLPTFPSTRGMKHEKHRRFADTHGRSLEHKYSNSEVLAVNDRQQLKEKCASFDDRLHCDIGCNSSVRCLQTDKSLSDPSTSKTNTVDDAFDPCHTHNEVSQGQRQTVESILKAHIRNVKRRRVVLDDEEQSVVERIFGHIQCNNLDASKSQEGKTVKKKRKLILDDEDVDDVGFMKVAELDRPQSLKSDSSNANVSSSMRQCSNDSLDFKGDKLRKRGGQPGEEDPCKLSSERGESSVDVDLCSLKDGYFHSPLIEDTVTSINKSEAVPDSVSCGPPLPVIDPVWEGCFDICNEIRLPMVAHISSNACAKTHRGVGMMPYILCLDEKPISESLPNGLRQSRPTGERIALYFFPLSDSVRPLYDQILGVSIVQNIIWKVVLEEAELLIFPSTELSPGPYQKFQGKYYFWGVFWRKQAPISNAIPNVFVLDSMLYIHHSCL